MANCALPSNSIARASTPTEIAHDLSDPSVLRSKDVQTELELRFDDLLLSARTAAGLRQCGFLRPSPIQLQAIPRGRCGFDLVVQSKAGTGKTCVFAVLALEALQHNANQCTQSLIVAPTREIAIQIHEVIRCIGCRHEELRCALCIGGTEVKLDRAQMSEPAASGGKTCTPGATCQIVVGTPGRLKQLIELNVIKTRQIELFVLDEADKLMEDQFKAQIDDIYKRLPSDKQMIVTSATYSGDLALFLEQYMKAARSVRLGTELCLLAIQQFYVMSKAGHSSKKTLELKMQTFKRLLMFLEFQKSLVFTNFQARAPSICDFLNADEQCLARLGPTSYICAELAQEKRNQASIVFRNSAQKILVSTDVSARGIDIKDVDLVVNFDLPQDSVTYYHRIGRAGRFGQPGKAVSIVCSDPIDLSLFRNKIKASEINELLIC